MMTQPTPMRVERCRSCDAPIIWAITAGGKRMPVDEQSVPSGTVELTERGAIAPVATVVPIDAALSRDDLRTSHFATCPQAGQWRKGGQS